MVEIHDFMHCSQDEIVCCYCGHRNIDSWEYTEDNTEYTCGACEKTMELEVYISVLYSTKKMEDKEK